MGMFKRDKQGTEGTEASLVWGMPTRCPACAKPGYLDRVDLVDKVMFQHCPWCATEWQTSEAEIMASRPVTSRR
jgi:hypothetical protein